MLFRSRDIRDITLTSLRRNVGVVFQEALLFNRSIRENMLVGRPDATDAELVSAAVTKLKILGLTDAQIRKLAQGQSAATDLILPKGSVWVYAEVFEYEVATVKIGQVMDVSVPALSSRAFSGQVSAISPVLNPQTRTVRVRAARKSSIRSLRQTPPPLCVAASSAFRDKRLGRQNTLGFQINQKLGQGFCDL